MVLRAFAQRTHFFLKSTKELQPVEGDLGQVLRLQNFLVYSIAPQHNLSALC